MPKAVDPLADQAKACAFATAEAPGSGLPKAECPNKGVATGAACNLKNRFCEDCGESNQACCPIGSKNPGCNTASDASNQCYDKAKNPIPPPPNTCRTWTDTLCDACQNACTSGQSCCSKPGMTGPASCVDLSSDPKNCGRCDHVCQKDLCVGGMCIGDPTIPVVIPPKIAPAPNASAWGDPHDQSWDGVHFDFQYVGEFLLATDGANFIVQARQEPWGPTSSVATVTAVAAKVNGSRVEIDAGTTPVLKIDGVPSAAVSLPEGGSASPAQITWPDGTSLSVSASGHLDLSFRRASSLPGLLSGVLGSQDGITTNDLMSRDGKTTFSMPLTSADFANSWRISMAESLFSYAPGTDTTTFTDLTFPSTKATAGSLSPADYEAARKICAAAGVTDPAILEDCILDVAVTGEASYAQRAAVIKWGGAHGQIVSVVAAPDSGKIDLVGVDDGALSPDGIMDVALTVVVQGPIAGFVVYTIQDPAGTTPPKIFPSFSDTAVGAQRYYDATDTSISQLGSDTPGMAVYESGHLISNADGSMPSLEVGLHTLTLRFADIAAVYNAGIGSTLPLNHYWNVSAIQPDGTVDIMGSAVTVP